MCCATLAIAGCSTSTRSPQNLSQRWIQASYWLLGERHDAPEHQQLAADTLQTLAQSGRLRALDMEPYTVRGVARLDKEQKIQNATNTSVTDAGQTELNFEYEDEEEANSVDLEGFTTNYR